MSPLRIGFVGSGFIAKFHAKSFQSVRHAQITGVYSPTAANRERGHETDEHEHGVTAWTFAGPDSRGRCLEVFAAQEMVENPGAGELIEGDAMATRCGK